MNKLPEKIAGSIMIVGIIIMGIGIFGGIFSTLGMLNIDSGISMAAPLGFLIVFVGGIGLLATGEKHDALVSEREE